MYSHIHDALQYLMLGARRAQYLRAEAIEGFSGKKNTMSLAESLSSRNAALVARM